MITPHLTKSFLRFLEDWIKSDIYSREGKAVTNFSASLPAPQSKLAQETLKDPYLFDFITIAEDHREKLGLNFDVYLSLICLFFIFLTISCSIVQRCKATLVFFSAIELNAFSKT